MRKWPSEERVGRSLSFLVAAREGERERSVWRAMGAAERGEETDCSRRGGRRVGGEVQIRWEMSRVEAAERRVRKGKMARGRLYRAFSMFSKVASACSKKP